MFTQFIKCSFNGQDHHCFVGVRGYIGQELAAWVSAAGLAYLSPRSRLHDDRQRHPLGPNYTRIVGIAILYYDYLVTFDDEVQYIWRYKGSSLWLFYINRYFSLVAIIPELAISFPSILGTNEACHQFTAYSQIIIVVAQLIVSVVLLLRTFALYDRSWRILGLMLSVGLPLVGFIIWSIAIQETGSSSIYMGCTVAGTPKSQFCTSAHQHLQLGFHVPRIDLSIAWMALILFDILIFLLTIMKTYQERRTCHSAILGRMGSLIDLIYKDGAIYFGIMASVNIANTITFYTLPPALQACLSRLASSISVSLMTRLILNLRKQAFTRTIETGLDPRMSLNFSDVCVNPEIGLNRDQILPQSPIGFNRV
ncbi:hypothetical protein C8Q75DRAFT_614677 [Abortiporus biennis]|nr:hypothetical protein C8Q75DRAFT_614677 [Abortiporus biennis]